MLLLGAVALAAADAFALAVAVAFAIAVAVAVADTCEPWLAGARFSSIFHPCRILSSLEEHP